MSGVDVEGDLMRLVLRHVRHHMRDPYISGSTLLVRWSIEHLKKWNFFIVHVVIMLFHALFERLVLYYEHPLVQVIIGGSMLLVRWSIEHPKNGILIFFLYM